MSERGSFLPLLALGLALLIVGALVLGTVGRAVTQRARAQAAADAAALAGVVEGREAAEELARANGATLLSFRVDGRDTIVEVRVGRATAEARATVDGAVPPAPRPSPVH